MKKIGIVDYYLSEWHANNYPAWIKECCEQTGMDYRIAYAWAEKEISPLDGIGTDAWCEKFDAEPCGTLEELCEKSDVIMVLAPGNPEKHLAYTGTVLRYGKPTYIDKTFAPSLAEAEEIFRLARQSGTAFFSSSALRYAEELKDAPELKHLIITAGGSDFPEYLIHPVEMAVLLLKDPVHSVSVKKQGTQRLCEIRTEHGKQAAIVFAKRLPYLVSGETPDGEAWHREIRSSFFKGLIADILHFYETGDVSFDSQQTLDVMRMRDQLLSADQTGGAQ